MYAVSKSGLLGIVRTLAVEWATWEFGQSPCTVLFPRITHSGSVFICRTSGVGALEDPDGIGVWEDLSGAVRFLLSDASNYITGQVINVDRGWLSG